MDERYEVTVTPSRRFGWRLQEVPCLRVWVYDRQTWRSVGSGDTRSRSQDEASRIAARLISEWESSFSRVRV
jgi:hypothetical protein